MTIPVEVTQPDVYIGDGTSTDFATSFKLLDETHAAVNTLEPGETLEQRQELNVDYTVAGVGDDTATISFIVAPTSGALVSLFLEVPITQQVDYTNTDLFDAEVNEGALDKGTQIDQQLAISDGLSLKFPTTDTGDRTLPPASERAEKLLGFDTNGEPIAVVSGRAQVAVPHKITIVDGVVEYALSYQVTAGADLFVYTQGQWFTTEEYETTQGGTHIRFLISLDDLTGSEVEIRYIGNALLTGQVADGAINRPEVFADNVVPLRAHEPGTPGTIIGYGPTGEMQEVTTFIVGEIKMCASGVAMAGWLECDGAAVSRTTYAALFAAIGETYGPGDGSTTFNIPNFQGRAPYGVGRGDTFEGGVPGSTRARGQQFGFENHTMTENELPPHTHDGVVDGGPIGPRSLDGAGSNATGPTSQAGGGQTMPIQSPGLAVAFLIFAGG